MAALVYALCAATALVCCGLLFRGYRRSVTPLLFWSGLCFAGLALDNVILFVDHVLLPGMDLTVCRQSVALISVVLLLYGMIWKPK